MKTSNKILIGLLVFIFTVPLLLAYSLKSKVAKGEYTIESKNKGKDKLWRSGSIQPFKVVKVVGPHPENLHCKLKLSNKMDYKFYNETPDSVRVFNSGDTLYIQCTSTLTPEELHDADGVVVDLNVPAFNSIIVDGASVVLDSLTSDTANLNVILKNKGVIRDGTKKPKPATDKTTSHVAVKKDRVAHVAGLNNVDVTDRNTAGKIKQISKMKIDLLDIDIKDLLLYRLLCRS
jgi:hypothetical protein